MITVAIVDQELTFADALAIRLDAEDDIKVVAVAKASSGSALGGCADIVLLDADLAARKVANWGPVVDVAYVTQSGSLLALILRRAQDTDAGTMLRYR